MSTSTEQYGVDLSSLGVLLQGVSGLPFLSE